jgi:hypothetical protein
MQLTRFSEGMTLGEFRLAANREPNALSLMRPKPVASQVEKRRARRKEVNNEQTRGHFDEEAFGSRRESQ